MTVTQIPLERLLEAEWNANRVSRGMLARIRRSIVEYGLVENLVARPHPEQTGRFEVLSGNHRLRLLHEWAYREAPGVVVELDDPQARASSRAGKLVNDGRADWAEAYLLTNAPVAYLWHGALHSHEAWDGLVSAGFQVRGAQHPNAASRTSSGWSPSDAKHAQHRYTPTRRTGHTRSNADTARDPRSCTIPPDRTCTRP